MQHSAKIDPRVSEWLESKRNKYIHGDYQNEIIRIMAFILFHDIAKNINESHELIDSSNVEQLLLSF